MRLYFRHIQPILVSLGLFLFTGLFYLGYIPSAATLLQRMEAMTYDLRMRITVGGKPEQLPPIMIADIDERSLQEEGQWPWPRQKLAALVGKLSAAGASVIALDITLSEPEPNPIDQVVALLPEMENDLRGVRDRLAGDHILADTIRDKNVILGYLFHQDGAFQRGQVKPGRIVWEGRVASLSSLVMQGYTANLPVFAAAAVQNGFFNVFPDDDGVIRRTPLVMEWDGKLYASLALEAVRHYLGAGDEDVRVVTQQVGKVNAITHIRVAGKPVRTDASGQVAVPFLGMAGVFSTVSAADILHGRTSADFTDAIVLVGASAKGLADIRTTPLQPGYPGVEIQATLVHGLLNPELIPFEPEWVQGGVLVELSLLAMLMVMLYPRLQPRGLILAGMLLLVLVVGFNLWLWARQYMMLPLMPPLLLVLSISILFGLYRLLHEYHERQRIQDMFGQYVPAEHIDRLLISNLATSMDGERREMTVLFSDIRRFTAISEHLSTQQLKRFLNHYLTPLTAIIFHYQGTVDKYVGDLVMAFWGAPLPDAQHAQRAVLAALDMQAKIRAMQPEFQQLGLIQPVEAGIGIHSGEMNVGDMGSAYRRAYTVLGDAVNLGARLEGLTKYYGVPILVSADTVQQCPQVAFRVVDCVRVKGRMEPVWIYEPLGLQANLSVAEREQLALHQQAMQAYFEGQWGQAREQLTALADSGGAMLYALCLERMRTQADTPPIGWDGVFNHQDK